MRITLPKSVFKKSKACALVLMLILGTFSNTGNAQVYCSTSYGTGTGSGDWISLVEFVGTSLNNPSAGASSPFYTFFPNTGATTTSLTIGTPYNLNVGGGTYGTCHIGVWGDWNQDGTFSASEFMGVSPNVGALATAYFSGSFIIPYNALAGQTRIRLRSSDTSPGPGASDACGTTNSNYGETEDYEITVLPLPSCSGTPYAGNAISSSTLICPNTAFNLDLVGNTLESGMTYQWQSSVDGTVWSNMGTQQISWGYSVSSIPQSLLYRCISTCTSSTQSDTSTTVSVNLNPLINCYCMPNWPNFMVDCTQDSIAEFSIANVISQNTNCDSYGFSDSTMSNYTSINLVAGNTYTLSATSGISGFNGDGIMGAWIDYDQNGVFDSNEFTSLGFGASGTYSTYVNVPFTAPTGTVRMRLMLDAYYAYPGTNLNPCANNPGSLGQILDYKVNITAAPACSLTPNGGSAVSSLTNVCTNTPYTLYLAGNDAVSGINYQWQSSPDGSLWTDLGVSQPNVPLAVSSQTATTHYQCVLTCTNSAISATSTPVVVVQNLPTTCYCVPDYVTCSNGAQMTDVTVAGVSYTPACNAGDNYYDLTSTPSMSLSLNANQTYTITATIASPFPRAYVGAWLDYNQNGIFDSAEYMNVGDSVNGTIIMPFTVPLSAMGGNTRLRLKMESISSVFPGFDPCTANYSDGTNIDYFVNITPAPPCTGAPNAGDATSSYTAICANTTLKLNLVNSDIVSNLSYQWQYSTDNVAWFNLGTAQTDFPYEVWSQTMTTHYRCITTCTSSAMSGTSTPITVTQNPLMACYCIPGQMDCASGDEINYVAFATMTNTSACSGPIGFEDFTGTVASSTISAGQSYTMTTVLGYTSGEHVSVWIDYDQNGTFDSNEYTFLGSNSGNDTIAGAISIPVTANVGLTRMRVRNISGNSLNSYEACITPQGGGAKQIGTGFTTYGETEDYLVTIMPPDCGLVSFPNAISASGASIICLGQSTALDLAPVLPVATGITFQWMSSTGGAFGNEGIASGTTAINVMPATTSYYYCDIMCNGSSVLLSDTVAVTVDIVTASVTGSATACFSACNGSASVTPVSGSGPFVYSWSPAPATTPSVTGLCAGIYSVTVMDINGCASTNTVMITEPTALTAVTSATNTLCSGSCDGSAEAMASGGVAPYLYSWTPVPGTTSSITGLCAGNYTVSIMDANSCMITETVTITEPTPVTASATQTNVTCNGLNNGMASVLANGGTSAYTYQWLPSGGTNDTEINMAPGTYTVQIKDANNCILNQTVTITEPGAFSASISGSSSSICEQLEDTLTSTVGGGIAPFTYSWNELPSTIVSVNATYVYTTSVGTHSYNLTVTDASNCTAISNTLNISVNPSSNFSGMVTTNPSIPVAGRVVLYKYLPFFTKFDSVAGQNIAANGSFLFNSFTSGTYIIKAIPTATNMQVTYGDSAVNWKTARQIIHGCAVNDVQDINVKALGTFTATGTGLLSGHIKEGNGFGKRMGTGFKTAAPGNPIGGIIVKGGKNPGGQMFVQTMTDTSGAYVLQGLPPNGFGESYFILVDIPGLDTNGTYDGLIINITNNQYTNLDFIVDSAKINPINTVSVNDISAKEHSIKVFPNPASSKVTIQYSLKDDANVKIELFDVFGKSVRTVLNQGEQSMDQHSYSVPLDGLASGMYFIKININGAESTIKLSVTN
ncbi:MAG: hypothetical protein K0S26_1781 [Bacteroidota bacterium]|jgi:hypothetical protein|nr:hypothetical protein [Bacteroidota bacterium]